MQMDHVSSLLNPRPVKLLNAETIHRIAAGEVVDRPASVIKELLDNSVDAQATAIKIQIVDGGLQLIEVEDNGWGISRSDLEVCVQRHATSKISSIEELEEIHTLGFRGEALSAVASVSRLKIETMRGQEGAWELEVLGGEKMPVSPSTKDCLGTRVQIRDLFFNIPARKKFLKKSQSEARECLEVILSVAMAHPEVEIEWFLISAKGEVLKQGLCPRQSLEERFVLITGIAGKTYHVVKENPQTGIAHAEVVGFLPPVSTSHQKIWLSVNGRAIVDKRLAYSLREAFSGLIEVQSFPVAVIHLKVDPHQIDVNIHPQKKEIRWPSNFSLASEVYRWVRPVLQDGLNSRAVAESPQGFLSPENLTGSQVSFAETIHNSYVTSSRDSQKEIFQNLSGSRMAQVYEPLTENSESAVPLMSIQATGQPSNRSIDLLPISSTNPQPPFRFSELRVVGEVGAAWLIAESPRGLVLIDQHAAHERVEFERILEKKDLLRPRPLLLPLVIKLPLGLTREDEGLCETLRELGFEWSDRPSLAIDEFEFVAVPEADRKIHWERELESLFNRVLDDKNQHSVCDLLKVRLAASLACHGSVRRGQRLVNEQIAALFQQLDQVKWSGLCPHGRPLWYELSHENIENLFHR